MSNTLKKSAAAKKGGVARNTLLSSENSPIPNPAGTGPTEVEKMAEEEKVKVFAPKAYKLTLDDGTIVDVAAGHQNMPLSMYNHWYSQVNGVELTDEE